MRPIIDFLDKHTWLKKKWGDLVTLNYGKRLTDYQQGTGPVPVYGTNGPIGYTHKALYDKPTIIVGRKGAYRGVYYSERPCFVIDTAFYVTPLLDIDLKWAYYALLSCDINTLDSGSAIPSTSRDAFYNLDVYLPPLETQKEIAHILGTLDDKIELNRKMCKTLEEIAQTLFKHWFIDFEFPNEQGKPYKSSGGDMVDSELGPIPKGWSVVGLSDEFSITMGQSPPGSTYNQTGDGLPFFQGNADFGFRFPVNRVFCSDPRRVARPGDTLISVRAPVGEINMAHDLCCIGRGISSVMHKSGSNAFTYYAMHSLKKKLSSFNDEGTVFGCIGKKDFNLMKWLKTSVGIVFAYDSYASNLDRMINSRSRQILMLYRLKLTLIEDLIVFWSSNAS